MPPSKSSRTSTAAAAPTAAPNAGGGAPAAAGARQGVHAAPAAAAAPEPAAAAPKAPRKPLKINDLVTIPVALFGQEWCELNYPAATHGAGWWKLPGSRLQGRVKANGDNPGWWKIEFDDEHVYEAKRDQIEFVSRPGAEERAPGKEGPFDTSEKLL